MGLKKIRPTVQRRFPYAAYFYLARFRRYGEYGFELELDIAGFDRPGEVLGRCQSALLYFSTVSMNF